MGKRKKSIFYYIGQIFVLLYRLIEYIVKAVYYLLKGIVTGIGWIFTKIFDRDKNKTIIEDKIIVDEKPILKDETKPIKKTDVKHGSISSKPMHENFKEIKTIKGDYQEFENKILDSSSTIGIILGARGTGKTLLASIGSRSNPGDFLSNRGRTTRRRIAPSQIPACGITAPGSSKVLAFV